MSEEKKGGRSNSLVGCVLGFGVLAGIVFLLLLMRAGNGSPGIQSGQAQGTRANTCGCVEYRAVADPMMSKAERLASGVSLGRDEVALRTIRQQLRDMRMDAIDMSVPACMDLKHDTLITFLQSTERTITAIIGNDADTLARESAAAELNHKAFTDWTFEAPPGC